MDVSTTSSRPCKPSTDPHPHGLQQDLLRMAQVMQRRRALGWLAGAGAAGGLALLGACGGGSDSASDTSSSGSSSTGGSTSGGTTSGSTTSTDTCSLIPSETAGPYPGDGTNSVNGSTVNVLTLSDIVRSDIRSSVGGLSGTAEGVPITVTLKLVNTSSSCANLAGRAIYLWHCTRDGNYSLYSSSVQDQNFLRGVQETDANGEVTFTSIFPGCYSGRWPHIHFEVFESLAEATSGNNDVRTSQLAVPAAACSQVYGVASGYSASVNNFAQVSLSTDNVFSDTAGTTQLATVTGDVTNGFAMTLVVGIAA
jgi:protocatechuate 3,4-dioxygenase beta subunit